MEAIPELSGAQRTAVTALVAAAAASDGAQPLNEDARLHLAHPGALHRLVEESGALVGYAQWQPAHGSGQLVVHPGHRRRGVGTTLLESLAVVADPVQVWAFRDLPAAQSFAAARGLAPARSLLVLGRDLGPLTPRTPPPGIRLTGFAAEYTEGFLATNAAAFAGHPEQGSFSAGDLALRQAEDWWDPEGLVLALDDEGVAGFHWTKRHDDGTGEVYVLGVHPRAAGVGLGGVLLDAGLAHLHAGGADRVILYVDARNTAAVRLYERGGFTLDHADTLYGSTR